MDQLERSKLITYRWWRSGKLKINPDHVPTLEEKADERIAEMMAQGFTSGELHDHIHMTAKDPENSIEYSGYWEVKQPVGAGDRGAEISRAVDFADPDVKLHPFDRIREILLLALWREKAGDCPHTSDGAVREWRDAAIKRYRTDVNLYRSVEYTALAVVAAAHDFFKEKDNP